MVKGVSHRVIVVKEPDKYFEEAIFVIREDVLQARGADSACVMRQARQAANDYVKKRGGKPRGSVFERLPAPLFAAAGAAATGIAWLAMHLCHV
ncbi:MAG: translation initiation factor 2 [Oscillospiraceae bacterium]